MVNFSPWWWRQLGLVWPLAAWSLEAGSPPDQTLFRVNQPQYGWEWNPRDDVFRLTDGRGNLMATGPLQPRVVGQPLEGGPRRARRGQVTAVEQETDRVRVTYGGVNGNARLQLELRFTEHGLWLDAPLYTSTQPEDVVSVAYFATDGATGAAPSLACSHFVVPGLCMGAGVSPIVPAQSGLHVTASLGAASGQEHTLFQQWGLPSHFFAGFNASGGFNVESGFTRLLSDGFCCGLAELPAGDCRLELDGGRASLVIAYRSDLWNQARGPGAQRLGARLLLTVASTWPEAVRAYYQTLQRQGLLPAPVPITRSRRAETALLPQFNTWGASVAAGKAWNKFDDTTLEQIYAQLKLSGLKAGLFVVDAKWEGDYGTLEHSAERFPRFESFLERARADGFRIGLWAAFLRCENPLDYGLTLDHVFRTVNGTPITRHEGPKPFYLLDFTQPEVEAHLRRRAAAFVRRYRPDLVKFDFGYELPSLDVAAPKDRRYAGERLLPRALDIVLGAMREVNPDLAVMYYGLSPFLVGQVDLHSPDDLWLNPGDYDLEANRRFLFSSLLGELGMPTLGSTGYDWVTAPSIWFDASVMGTLGSLQSFAGDELDQRPAPGQIAKYNGLTRLLRPNPKFTVIPLDTLPRSAVHGANAGSWVRLEDGEAVMVALRERDWAGHAGVGQYLDLLQADASVVAASLTSLALDRTPRFGLVPYGLGTATFRRQEQQGRALVVAYPFRGEPLTNTWPILGSRLRMPFREQTETGAPVEWLDVTVLPGAD